LLGDVFRSDVWFSKKGDRYPGEERSMQRRLFLKGSVGVSAAIASTFPAPAIAQGVKELNLVTSWPKGFPGLGTSAERLAKRITETSGGRLKVNMFAAGEMVGAFEV
jgi:TRAP-type mannitol/chloroaromatic compound transport system substrate-binding protein